MKILTSEGHFDRKRRKKLDTLKNEKHLNYNKITVHNWTDVVIPDDVKDLLSLGKNVGVGSNTDNTTETFKQFDDLFLKVQSEARKAGVPEITISGLKCHTVLTATKIAECKTLDKRVKVFKKFMFENENLMIATVDKRADLVILEKSVYHKKLKMA